MDDVEKNIQPAMTEGKIVIMDRYYYSTIAYQGALGLDVETIREKNEKFAPRPELVIILDAPPKTGLDRITKGRKESKMENKPRVRLVGEDGNAFAIMGKVREALKESGAVAVICLTLAGTPVD